MDGGYSPEFEEFIANLNSKLKSDFNSVNLNTEVDDNVYKIFDETEVRVWKKRILTCSYLFLLTANKHLADVAFNIYHSEDYTEKLFKHIIKRSIYEYYFALKYNADSNSLFSNAELQNIVDKIESEWVR